jgi:hypothetical protein
VNQRSWAWMAEAAKSTAVSSRERIMGRGL